MGINTYGNQIFRQTELGGCEETMDRKAAIIGYAVVIGGKVDDLVANADGIKDMAKAIETSSICSLIDKKTLDTFIGLCECDLDAIKKSRDRIKMLIHEGRVANEKTTSRI